MYVDMVDADRALENDNIFRIADLNEQLPTALLNVTPENVITVFGDPYKMGSKACNGVAAMPIGIGHSRQY